MPALDPELMTPYRVLLGRSPVGMGPNRRPLPLYVTLYTLTMTTLPLTSYVMPDWSVTALDSDSWDTELLTEFNSKQADLNSRRIVCRIDGKRYAAALRINALHSTPACRNWNKSPAFVSPFVCHEDFAVCNARSATCLCRCEYLPSSDLNRGYGISRPDDPLTHQRLNARANLACRLKVILRCCADRAMP